MQVENLVPILLHLLPCLVIVSLSICSTHVQLSNRLQSDCSICEFVKDFVCLHRALEDRMREYDMFDLRPFYLSKEFQSAQFQLDQGAGLISVRRA